MAALPRAYADAGRREEASRILEDVLGSIYPLSAAVIYARLGEADAAFEWVEKAYERRSYPLMWIRVNPSFDPFRSDPRYADLLRRMNLAE